jgi:hypothetical protein
MAIVLTEEARRHLEEIRALLQRAVTMLLDLTEAEHSELGQALQQSLRWTLLQPLQLHIAVLDQLLGHGTLRASQSEPDTGLPGTTPDADDSPPS